MNITMRDVYERAKSVSTVDIAEQMLDIKLVRRRGSEMQAYCPFPGHNDRHLGSFSININSGKWGCFACSHGGHSGVSLVEQLLGLSSDHAALQICLTYRLISRDEYDTFCEKLELREKNLSQIKEWQRKQADKAIVKNKNTITRPKAAPALLDQVYRCFIQTARTVAPMSETELACLMKTRWLSEQDMEHFFKMPTPSKEFFAVFKKELSKTGLNAPLKETLKHIPGFFWDTKKKTVWFWQSPGDLGIIVHDLDGKVTGIQIRHETKSGEKRYSWFSSGGADENNEYGYRLGTTIGTLADVLLPEGTPIKTIAITEGKFKGLKLTKMRMYTLGLHGVGNWRCIMRTLPKVIKHARFERPHIMLFFDADIQTNAAVAKAGKGLAEALMKKGYHVLFATWDIQYGKGVDDVINSGHKDKLSHINAPKFIKNTLDPLIAKAEQEKKENKAMKSKAAS